MRVFLAIAATALIALVVASPAVSWTWPVEGPIVRPFLFGDDPYAAGQHRGVDIEAAVGAAVRAPSAGAVTFAGTVPRGGVTVTISTAEGYAVTLQQLAGVLVARGDVVGEGDPVGKVAESRDPVAAYSHVHLGVRLAGVEHGYIDPLPLLAAGVSDSPAAAAGSSEGTEASTGPASAAGPSSSGDGSEPEPEEAGADPSPAEEVVPTGAAVPGPRSLAPPQPADSAPVASPAPPPGEPDRETDGSPEAQGAAADEMSSSRGSMPAESAVPAETSVAYEPRAGAEPSPPTIDQLSDGETPAGGAERGAASDAVDPVDDTTTLASGTAGRDGTDEVASESAGSEPSASAQSQEQPVPAEPAMAGPSAGVANAPGEGEAEVEVRRVAAEHSPAPPAAAAGRTGKVADSPVVEGPSPAVPPAAGADALAAHERSGRQRGQTHPRERERPSRSTQTELKPTSALGGEPADGSVGSDQRSVLPSHAPDIRGPGPAPGHGWRAPAELAPRVAANAQFLESGSGGSRGDSHGAIAFQAVELPDQAPEARRRVGSGGLSEASIAAFLVAGLGLVALLLVCRRRPPGTASRTAARPRPPAASTGSVASPREVTHWLDCGVSNQLAGRPVERLGTGRGRRSESARQREVRWRRQRRRPAHERRQLRMDWRPSVAHEGRCRGALAPSGRGRRL